MNQITDTEIYQSLREAYGVNAKFKSGQLEAIRSVVDGQRSLVVQKTGWGKSLVYFLSTKLLREHGSGPTIVISPLLSLMRNQVEAAERFGLKASTINSSNRTQLTEIIDEILNNQVDILFISPERLSDSWFTEKILPKIPNGLGMIVIDEAHCISDWGHDFRPDYRRISRVLKLLPSSIPVLATTATANNRVVRDIVEQLQINLQIYRGSLTRNSLRLQNIVMEKKSERFSWLAKNVPNFKGSGIIYCSTIQDCELLAKWLTICGISAEAYHGQLKPAEREQLEQRLIKNEVKVLVANLALGMGFDKDDIGFVIHFQIPASLIAYYQQIGRAGRKLKNAYIVLLHGIEDKSIQEYFIRNAFPPKWMFVEVEKALAASDHGLTRNQIAEQVNIPVNKINDVLKILGIEQAVIKEGSTYIRTTYPFQLDEQRLESVRVNKTDELNRMLDYVYEKGCLMQFIAKELDDLEAQPCGKCANCTAPFISVKLDEASVTEAMEFLKTDYMEIKPRERWSNGKHISSSERCEKGFVLSRYGDYGWGKIVRDGKYKTGRFHDTLVKASAKILIKELLEKNSGLDFAITYIPSFNQPALVKDFATRLAKELGLPLLDILEKTEQRPAQKNMENSFQQEKNVQGSLKVVGSNPVDYLLILVDDMVDSGWTFTVAGMILKGAGYEKVYPFALSRTTK